MPEGIIGLMQFSLITNLADWQSLEAEWQSLFAVSHRQLPFLEFWYQSTWWQTLGGGEWSADASQLQIITAREDNQLVGIAPLFCSEKDENPPALRFIGQIEVSDYLDFLCAEESLQPFLSELLDFIKTDPQLLSRRLDLANFQEESPSLPLLRELSAQNGWQWSSEILQPSPYIPLQPSWDEYLASISKKQRHEIRRKLRNAEARYKTDWYYVTAEDNLPQKLETFIAMMHQDPSKQTFLTPQMRTFLTETAAGANHVGELHLSFLTFDGKDAAAYLSFLADRKLWVYNSAWDMEFSPFSPGWVLLAKIINWAIEQNLTEVDMMRGDEVYKYRFGGIDRHVLSFRANLLCPSGTSS